MTRLRGAIASLIGMHGSMCAELFSSSSYDPTGMEPGLSQGLFVMILNCFVSENRLSAAALLCKVPIISPADSSTYQRILQPRDQMR